MAQNNVEMAAIYAIQLKSLEMYIMLKLLQKALI